MNRRTREFKRAYRQLYGLHVDTASLLKVADGIASHRFPIHGRLFAVNTKLEELVRALTLGRRRSRGFTVSVREPYLVELPPRQTQMLPHPGKAKAFLLGGHQDRTACLIGLGADVYSLWQDIEIYLRSRVDSLFLRTGDFEKAFRGVSREGENEAIRVRSFTASVLCDDGQSVKTRREWFPVAKGASEFFGELEQEKQWLRSVEVIFFGRAMATARIGRDLHFSCQGGVRAFYNELLQALCVTAAERRGILQNRAARDTPRHASRPIRISYDTRLFDDKRQNHRLIEVLRLLPDTGLSVYHANPLLHAALIDYSDGSSYGIWITDNSAITIVPELKGSAGSLSRLCNHINEYFSEGVTEGV